MKVVLHHDTSQYMARLWLERRPDWIDLAIVSPSDKKAVRNELAEAEVLFHVLAPANRWLMETAPRLRLIQKIGVGVNTIDLAEAARREIAVTNMPGSNSSAVAEMTLALMLTAIRRIVPLSTAIACKSHDSPSAKITDGIIEVREKTVGLIGFGSIARLLAPILQAMGAQVIHTARSPHRHWASTHVPLEELIRKADIISLHLPLSSETAGMVDARFLSKAKRGIVLINTARGELVDENALHESLVSGQVGCAALDVLCEEPPAPDNPLLLHPNAIVTPHVSWLTHETIVRSNDIAWENCRRHRDGIPLLHRITH